jgi:protein phosphatase
MKIELYPPLYIHEIGQRDNQEDALWPMEATADNRLFVLCDGMGGHEHGEVASQTVCQSLGKWFQEHIDSNDPLSKDQVLDAIEYAYIELDKYADGSPRQMGTTLTLLYIGKNGVTAAHMGDSRIYHIRPNVGILYQSRDHSLATELFQAGEITYEEMLNYPKKNIVTRAMMPGEENRMHPDIIHITDIQPNDYFYICSDGMLEGMTNNKLFSILTSEATDDEKQKELLEVTNDNQDNHSAWIIHVKHIVKEDDDIKSPNEELVSRCNIALNYPVEEKKDDDVVIVKDEKKSLFQRIVNIIK